MMIKEYIKEYRKPVVFAVLQWLITVILQVDRMFFAYEQRKIWLFYGVKAVYLCFLVLIWCFVFYVYKKVRSGDKYFVRGFKIFLAYLSVLMVFLLFLWPGTWSWDDILILESIDEYTSVAAWQHFLSGVYHFILLQILPFPGGLIIMQCVLTSICTAFSIVQLEKTFGLIILKNRIVDTVLKLIPFLLPPVLLYQFSGYRMGLYIYLEMVMLVIMITATKNKRRWSWIYTIMFCGLCVLSAAWRTESFVYVPFVCLWLVIYGKSFIDKRKIIVSVLLIVLGFLAIDRIQAELLGDNNYQVISLMRPCVELVRIADLEVDADELSMIDKVANLQVVREHPDYNGEQLYWSTDCVRTLNDNPDDDYTPGDYRNFLKAFVRLTLKYPKVVAEERWKLFLSGAGVYGPQFYCVISADVFEENSGNSAAEKMKLKNWILNKPVFSKERSELIRFMCDLGAAKYIIINAIIPMIFLVYAWIKTLIQKRWDLCLVASGVVFRLPIVVLTQPSAWFMYVLSFYFLGYVYFVYRLWIYFSVRSRS